METCCRNHACSGASEIAIGRGTMCALHNPVIPDSTLLQVASSPAAVYPPVSAEASRWYAGVPVMYHIPRSAQRVHSHAAGGRPF